MFDSHIWQTSVRSLAVMFRMELCRIEEMAPFGQLSAWSTLKGCSTRTVLWQPCGCPAESKAEGISECLLVQVVAISQHWNGGKP